MVNHEGTDNCKFTAGKSKKRGKPENFEIVWGLNRRENQGNFNHNAWVSNFALVIRVVVPLDWESVVYKVFFQSGKFLWSEMIKIN